MNIIGISAFYHDAACCLLQDGELRAAAAEERFSRRKHDRDLPVEALRYCLREGGIDISDVDCIAYYEQPVRKLSRQLWAGHVTAASDALDVGAVPEAMARRLGYEGQVCCYGHALSHAASAYCYSGFSESAVLTADAVGEWTSMGFGRASGNDVSLFREVEYPHSLGLLYSALTAYLGFRVNSGEYKTMGLAAFGEPRHLAALEKLVLGSSGGSLQLDPRYFDFGPGASMYSPAMVDLLGIEPRSDGQPPTREHADLACSIQRLLEDLLLQNLHWLHAQHPSERLCMAGGVALNCVANARLRREGPFSQVFIPPAPGDDGAAMGAAALAQMQLGGSRPMRLQHAGWGPRWSGSQVRRMLAPTPLPIDEATPAPNLDDLCDRVARRLADGQIIGWFQGPMEWGPRALGGRSILADPRRGDAVQRINASIKQRESFRPFAPSVLADRAADWFVLDQPVPFMLETCAVRDTAALPAITHVDASARVHTVDPEQLPRFAQLLRRFEALTGCPVLLNTSFNMRGEPIVCTPEDALRCFVLAGLDALVLEDCLIDRSDIPAAWFELLAQTRRGTDVGDDAPSQGNLYAFA